jgi:hypothetical protein
MREVVVGAKPNVVSQIELLPVLFQTEDHPFICRKCRYVNQAHYSFCTDCGFPISAGKAQLRMHIMRRKQLKQLLQDCYIKISAARTTIYIIAAICLLGIAFLFSDNNQSVIRGILLLLSSTLFVALAKWSNTKPFTALLICLLMLVSYVAITTWTQFNMMLSSATRVYVLIVELGLVYFLVQGVKAAWQADILETEINYRRGKQ